MTPAEALFWRRLQRRVAGLEPLMARAILQAFRTLRDALPVAAFEALIGQHDVEALMRALDDPLFDRAFAPLRWQIERQVADGVRYFARDIPKAKGLGVMFNVLNPRMIDAVRTIDTKVIQALTTEVREVVRQVVERGLRDGVNPRTVARDLRAAIGLGPAQEQQVQNFRQALIDRDYAKVKTYLKRDKRFDSRIKRGDYGDAEIEKWTDIYRRRRIALNAETLARTAALDAQKQAQRLSWESAIDRGIVDRSQLMKRWTGTLDMRERETHLAQEAETVGFDERFENGQMIPGDTEYNCRCIATYSTRLKRQPAKGVKGTPAALAAAREARRAAL